MQHKRQETNQPSQRIRKGSQGSLRAVAIRASVVFHIALILMLACWYLPSLRTQPAIAKGDRSADVASSDTAKPTAIPTIPPAAEANVPDEEIKASLNSQIQAVGQQTDQRKLKELDIGMERLQRVVKPESVGDLVESVGRSVGVDTTMYADKAPVQGTQFNPNTAQLTGVERKKADDGRWTYEALLVDTNGNRSTVPMPAGEGAAAYDAFEKIKSMPMAGALYQQLVMPMLQQLVAPENQRPQGNVVIAPAPEAKNSSTQDSQVKDEVESR